MAPACWREHALLSAAGASYSVSDDGAMYEIGLRDLIRREAFAARAKRICGVSTRASRLPENQRRPRRKAIALRQTKPVHAIGCEHHLLVMAKKPGKDESPARGEKMCEVGGHGR